jgi:glycine/D-amino acid oxidase-like deaminating enzyme
MVTQTSIARTGFLGMPTEHVETLIVGGGQAGLALGHMLGRRGCPHLVLERGRIAERWRTERWDGHGSSSQLVGAAAGSFSARRPRRREQEIVFLTATPISSPCRSAAASL